MPKIVVLAACVPTLAGLLGFAVATAAPPIVQSPVEKSDDVQQVASQQPPPDHKAVSMLCAGGAADQLTVKIEPVRSQRGALGEQLSLSLSIGNELPIAARIVYSVELFDDRGNSLREATISPVRRVAARGQLVDTVLTPDGLPDGYYLVIVSAVSRARGEEGDDGTASRSDFYFKIESGAPIPLDYATWAMYSQANILVELKP
jgi:hypothetical protein